MTNQANDSAANDAGATGNQTTAGRLHGAATSVRDAAASAGSAAADALAGARDKVSDTVGVVKEKSGAAYTAAVDRTSEVYATAKDKAGEAYVSAKDKAGEAYDAAREKASQARQVTADGIEENPLAAVIGGIALGVLVGALLPRSKREADALGPIAGRLAETARAAAAAATEAGKQKLDELGINRDSTRGQVEKLVDTVTQAATSAGSAAAGAVRQ